ncbi:MAG: AraC family transcriptional regulator [Planctomycetota bacterium]
MPRVRMLLGPCPALPELTLVGTAEFQAAYTGLAEHDHGPNLEIVILGRGQTSYVAQGVTYTVRGGDLFSTPPHLVHSTGGNPQNKAHHAWIQIDLSRPPAGHTFLELPEGELLRRRLAALPVLAGRGSPDLYEQLAEIYTRAEALTATPPATLATLAAAHAAAAAARAHPPVRHDRLPLLNLRSRVLRFLLDYLAAAEALLAAAPPTNKPPQPRQDSSVPAAGAGGAPETARAAGTAGSAEVAGQAAAAAPSPAIAEAIAYMRANLAVPLAVGHIARACGYSTSAFKQSFRRETGLSPADYFLRLKIEEAKRRLATSDVAVTELAIDLGFSSGQYFATVFRRLTTQTPSTYRACQQLAITTPAAAAAANRNPGARRMTRRLPR